METKRKYAGALLIAAIGFVAAGAQAQLKQWNSFTQAVSDDWTDVGNWDKGIIPPGGTDTFGNAYDVAIGDPNFDGVSTTIYSGTNIDANNIQVGGVWDFGYAHYSGSGTMTIEAGASLTTTGGRWGLGNGNDGSMATVVVNGLYETKTGLDIGGYSPANVTIGTGGTIYIWGNLNMGHPSYMNEGWSFEVNQEGGVFHVDQWGGGFYISSGGSAANTSYYRAADGSLIKAHGVNGWTGFGFWLMGGTLDIAGGVTLEAPNGPAIFANQTDGPLPATTTVPVLKLSGMDPMLTISGNANFQGMGTSNAAQIDVSELTLSSADTWVTVVDVVGGKTLSNGNLAAFVAGTDGNDWQLQAVGNQLQVKFTGSVAPLMGDVNLSGLVDDDDLSLLLANWNAGTTWGTGDLNTSGNVDDDDLSLLLANWGAGGPPAPQAVPEPITLGLLEIGGIGLVVRRKR